jgi:probable poly-beta-1,6-N-acetyl-D-glucosamine export protein
MNIINKPVFHYNIHLLRGLAILIIILHHTHAPSFASWIKPESGTIAHFVGTFFLGNGTILYVFISGFLFQVLIEKYSYKKYLLTKIKYIFLPYLIMSSISILLAPLITGKKNIFFLNYEQFGEVIQRIALDLLTGNIASSYWYIPFICLIFLCAPIFVIINRAPRLYRLIFPLLCISIIVGRPITHPNPFHSLIYFTPIYMVGMFFAKYNYSISLKYRKLFGFYSLIVLLIMSLIQACISGAGNHLNDLSTYLINGTSILHRILLCFFLVNNLPSRIVWIDHLLGKFANASFGMFFVHDYVNSSICYILRYTKLYTAIYPSAGVHFIFFLLVLALSYSVAFCIKKVFGQYSRFIIGW